MPQAVGTFEIQMHANLRDFERFRQHCAGAAEYALRKVARELLRDSRLYVPVLTGALKDSGRVEDLPTFEDATRVVQVIYGSPQVLYAWLQHEVPFNHSSLGFFGPAKYLELPLRRNAPFYNVMFQTEVELYLQRQYGGR